MGQREQEATVELDDFDMYRLSSRGVCPTRIESLQAT
jgi:hypothetical protein